MGTQKTYCEKCGTNKHTNSKGCCTSCGAKLETNDIQNKGSYLKFHRSYVRRILK